MPAIQSTYTTMSAARAGQIADMQESYNAFSRTVSTAAGIAFGAPVQRGASDGLAKAIGDGSATTFLGVAVRTQSRDANNADKFTQYEDVRILDKGTIWVTASVAVTQGDSVYFVTATGAWTNSATSSTSVANAVWDTTTSGAGLAILRLK